MELKPCPFCGGEAELIGGPEDWTPTYNDPDSGGYPIAIVCTGCSRGLYGAFEDYSDAVNAWNQRTLDIDIPAERLAEICEAERAGRLIILLAPIGAPIYTIVPDDIDVNGSHMPAEIEQLHLSGYVKEGDREFYLTYDESGTCDIDVNNAYRTREDALEKENIKIKPKCFYTELPGQYWCRGYCRSKEDDEPIDACKNCWWCDGNEDFRAEIAEAALREAKE